MTLSLKVAQITAYQTALSTGGASAVSSIYEDLFRQGFNYAGWAGGVARADTVTGLAALDFLEGTAMMGIGSPTCQNLTPAQVDLIRLSMARGYLEALRKIAVRSGDEASRDVDYKETEAFHRVAFDANHLSIDNWTLKTPMDLIRQTEGAEAVEAFWQELRDTGGSGPSSLLVSAKLAIKLHGLASSSDPVIRAAAQAWEVQTPGVSSWKQFFQGASIAEQVLLTLIGKSNFLTSGYEALITAMQTEFGIAATTRSPLILDLDGDGVETVGTGAGIHFDHDGNRFGELSGWVGKDDGLLVWDRNGNGQIDSGAELFGNNTVMADGQKAANGFAALSNLDINHDGKMDAADAAFANLRVWKDANSNGVAEAGELLTLTQAGVKSIGTDFASQTVTDANNNQHLQTGTFTTTDGAVRAVDDVWFSADTARTTDLGTVVVSSAITALPDIAGMGNVASLRQAMAKDSTGVLSALVTQWIAATPTQRATLMPTLIYQWTGVQNIDPASRAATQIYGNVIGDARKLASLEALLGEPFLGTWCWGERDSNPHGPAAIKLLATFDKFSAYVEGQLRLQTDFKPLMGAILLTWNASQQQFGFDFSQVVVKLQAAYTADPLQGRELMFAFGIYLKAQDVSGSQLVTQLQALGNPLGTGFALELSTIGYNVILGTSVNDTLNGGVLADILDGGAGQDVLNGGGGGDILEGGLGSDWLDGGAGNDTYRFAIGSGVDTISEYDASAGNIDIAQFSNVASTAIRSLERKASDLVIGYGTTDQLTVSNYFSDAAYQVEQFKFSDGVTWGQADIKARVMTNGDASANYLTSFDDSNNRLYGLGGNDTLYGGAMADLLDGGAGDDRLSGGGGNDTYRFAVGSGVDTISEYDTTVGNADILAFGPKTAIEQLWFRKVANDLEVSIIGTPDKVTVSNWYAGSAYHVEQFQTAGGKVLLDSQVQNLVQAMASFAPPASGQTTLTAAYQTTLAPVLAANWH